MTRFPLRKEASGYTSREAARLCGVSLRQLQWWDERRIVLPTRLGNRREYSHTELYLVRVIAALRKRGIGLKSARAVIALVRDSLRRGDSIPRYVVGIEAWGRRTIARFYPSPEAVVEVLSQQAAGRVFVVTLPGGRV